METANTYEAQQKLFLSCLVYCVSRFQSEDILSWYKIVSKLLVMVRFWKTLYMHMLAVTLLYGFPEMSTFNMEVNIWHINGTLIMENLPVSDSPFQ